MKFGEGAAKERAAGGGGELRWIPVLKPHAHLCSLPAHQVHPSGQAVPSSRETEPFCKVGVQEQHALFPHLLPSFFVHGACRGAHFWLVAALWRGVLLLYLGSECPLLSSSCSSVSEAGNCEFETRPLSWGCFFGGVGTVTVGCDSSAQ